MSERNIQRLLLLAFSLSGAAALIYEVVWTRALSFVLGSTVYSLSILLATFMAGRYFALFELGIGLFGLVTVPLIYLLPRLYFWMYQSFHLNVHVYFVSQFFLCSLIMLVPTTLMGATFPVVSRRITHGMEEMGRKVGDAYSVNTFGAILGSLTAGFVLVPLLGIKWASVTGGLINLAVGTVLLFFSRASFARAAALVALLALAGGGAAAFFAQMRHPGATFYMVGRYGNWSFTELSEAERTGELLFSRDYAQGHINVFRVSGGFITIQHGGQIEGTTPHDVSNTVMLAALPAAAFGRKPESMLVIGLGAGITAGAGRGLADEVEVVEINPGVVEVVERFGLPGILEGIEVHLADARRFLLYGQKKYDVITSEPSVPSSAMAANLFTREFYEIASHRLSEGGIYTQWLPEWVLTPADLRSCYKTFASVFDYVHVLSVHGSADLIMLGSKRPFPPGLSAIMERASELARGAIPAEWIQKIEGAGEHFDEMFRVMPVPVNFDRIFTAPEIPSVTDDRPILEFAVTKNLLLGQEFRKHRD
jgi:spermidine synthase